MGDVWCQCCNDFVDLTVNCLCFECSVAGCDYRNPPCRRPSDAIDLTPAETDALAEWITNRWVEADWLEWGDVPFLSEVRFERLYEAVQDYVTRLQTATKKWTAEFDINAEALYEAANTDPRELPLFEKETP